MMRRASATSRKRADGARAWGWTKVRKKRTDPRVGRWKSAAETRTTRPGGGPEPDYYANVGDAIRTLRQDIPLLFQKDLDYHIYDENIVFMDKRNRFQGMKNYKLVFWSLRFHGRIFFHTLYVEVMRTWQPCEDVIMMRWRVHGWPRVPWETEGIFDGTSEYRLNRSGKIYSHKVDNVIFSDDFNMRPIPLFQRLVLTPKPTVPSLYFMYCLAHFSFVRLYFALICTLLINRKKYPGLGSGSA